MKCAKCDKERETKTDRLPPGWKRWRDQIWCQTCWHGAYRLRAATIPVAGPVDAEWDDLRAVLKECWAQATGIANWAVTELARNDMPREHDQTRIAKAPKLYLYPGARKVEPACNPQSVVAILHAVEGRYRKARLATIWDRTQAHPVYRFPQPYPVHNQGWSCLRGPGDTPCITVRLGDRRWVLRLRGGQEFHRQLAVWKQIALGQACQGELSLIGQWVEKTDHRPAAEMREPGGGPRRQLRVMVKMVAWLPRTARQGLEGTLYIRTSHPAFLMYHVGRDGEPRYLHAEHVKRWEAQHRRRLQAMADDLKYEKRWPAQMRRNMLAAQDRWVAKYRDRLDSFTHETTAMLAGFARRQGVATVVLDLTDQSFCERFPWHSLREKLAYKLDAFGIDCEIILPKGAARAQEV